MRLCLWGQATSTPGEGGRRASWFFPKHCPFPLSLMATAYLPPLLLVCTCLPVWFHLQFSTALSSWALHWALPKEGHIWSTLLEQCLAHGIGAQQGKEGPPQGALSGLEEGVCFLWPLTPTRKLGLAIAFMVETWWRNCGALSGLTAFKWKSITDFPSGLSKFLQGASSTYGDPRLNYLTKDLQLNAKLRYC